MDIIAIPAHTGYDVVIANAIFFALEDLDFNRAVASVPGEMKSGGMLLVFDFFHPWSQDITIIEKSEKFPDGLVLNFRPYSVVQDVFGCCEISTAFNSPQLETYTVKTDEGGRLQFRGPITSRGRISRHDVNSFYRILFSGIVK